MAGMVWHLVVCDCEIAYATREGEEEEEEVHVSPTIFNFERIGDFEPSTTHTQRLRYKVCTAQSQVTLCHTYIYSK